MKTTCEAPWRVCLRPHPFFELWPPWQRLNSHDLRFPHSALLRIVAEHQLSFLVVWDFHM